MNTYYLAGYNSTKKLNVALHEMGHALGLDHYVGLGNIMHKYSSETVDLSRNDKDSYDTAYARC